MQITEFLAARYDDAEEAARLAAAKPPHPSGLPLGTAIVHGLGWAGLSLNYQAYICMFDPPDVLADVAAKRALLALWQKVQAGVYSPDACQLADEVLEQLLAPYGKRAVWTREEGWKIDD